MKLLYNYIKSLCLILILLSIGKLSQSQETNSNISGIVKSETGDILTGATVSAIHEPTKNTYFAKTNSLGYFYFFHLKPGGPYTLSISFTGYEPVKKSNLYISYSTSGLYRGLQDNEFTVLNLKIKTDTLQEVKVYYNKNPDSRFGTETNINNQQMVSLPSINRNLQDFIRLVPQAKVNADGGISLAGQNNKYNSFFIDGTNNNDLLGLAPSGINGGQTASPPISIEAIEEIKILLAPYDVQYSNFTGGSMNAITKSGNNSFKSSAWFYFRNERMAGRSPQPLELSGSPGVFKRQRLPSFFNQTSGAWASGPFIKNKLFYFLLAEKQSEHLPQQYNFADYRGNSSQQVIAAFADTLRKKYGYEPGSFLQTTNSLNATRINIKLDWNPSERNKLSLSYRHNNAERLNSQTPNSATSIRFSNNQYKLLANTHTASLEWKAYLNSKINNRLLLTYTNHIDDRNVSGNSFPAIQVTDGAAVIFAGSNGSAHLNIFKGKDFSLLNVIKFIANKQVISTGVDLNFSRLNDIAIGNYFGQYQFRNFNDFFNSAYPSRFLRGVSLIDNPINDNTKGGAKFNTRRLGFFINNEIQVNAQLKFIVGLRIDGNGLPKSFVADSFFNATAKPAIEQYYNLEGATRGQLMNTHWQLSPRIGFTYKIPEEKMVLRGGAGLFTGHIINLWASEIYNANTFAIDVVPQFYNIRFNPDPYNQPGLQSLGINTDAGRRNISIVSKKYKYPVVFRTSISADKQLNKGWSFTTEFLFTKNIHENKYTNVNLLPPDKQTPLPDKRNVYSVNTTPGRIPMSPVNPYNNIILLSNNKSERGFSYSFTAVINKVTSDRTIINAAYSYGKSVALFEPTGVANTNGGQWASLKTVNGKNNAGRIISDFDPGHRLYVSITKKVFYSKKRTSTLISLFYNGQSGSRYSYVYAGSIINDNGTNTNNDLIYIPTSADLNQMIFLPNTINGITYTEAEQRQLLNSFIESDRYLNKHRGQFAETNGARLPFNNTIDLRVQQDFVFKTLKKEVRVSLVYDVFNFTNMINKRWGRIYITSNESYPLIRFAGFTNTNTLTPQYQFTPINGKPWSIQNSTAPGNSARWISQLGIRLSFN